MGNMVLSEKKEVIIFLLVLIINSSTLFLTAIIFDVDLHDINGFYDAPSYIHVARTFYRDNDILSSARFILFPAFIRLLSYFFGYNVSAIVMVQFFTALSIVFFYRLARLEFPEEQAFKIALVFYLFPPHKFINSLIVLSEPLFFLLLTLSLYYFQKENYIYSFIFAALSCLTRVTGIFLFFIYLSYFILEKKYDKIPIVFIIPLGLLIQFSIYYYLYGDFFVFVRAHTEIAKTDGIKFYAIFPFQNLLILYKQLPGNIYHAIMAPFSYILYGIALYRLYMKKRRIYFLWVAWHYIFIAIVSYIDISRFFAAAIPFVFAYSEEIRGLKRRDFIFMGFLSVFIATSLVGVMAIKAQTGFKPNFIYNTLKAFLAG